jgi:hypothetical protein
MTSTNRFLLITPREMHVVFSDIIPKDRREAQRRLMVDGEIKLVKTAAGMRLAKGEEER